VRPTILVGRRQSDLDYNLNSYLPHRVPLEPGPTIAKRGCGILGMMLPLKGDPLKSFSDMKHYPTGIDLTARAPN
jgi:hypothetical protein